MNIMFRNIANISYLDCSKSSIFPKNRRDGALCVTGCHLVRVSKLLRGGFGRKREKSYNPRRLPPRYICKSRWPPLSVRRPISRRSHEKIWDCEQSISYPTPKPIPSLFFISPLFFSLCYPKDDKASFIRKKTCPRKMGNPPSQVNCSERLCEKTIRFLCPSQELT